MFREFLKFIYYAVYQLLFSNFLMLKFFGSKKVIILRKKNFKLIPQNIRDLNDLNTLRQIFIKEEYKFNKDINKLIKVEYNKIVKRKKIPLIIDCGANICASANYFSLTYEDSEIVGIEPDQLNFDLCVKNKIKNSKIHLIKNAVSCDEFQYNLKRKNKDGRSSFIDLKKNNLNYLIDQQKTTTINDILINFQFDTYKPFIIKIDIEGHEKKLFEKNIEWMNYFKFIIIELHDWMLPGENISSNFYSALKNNINNYDLYNFGENTLIINKS